MTVSEVYCDQCETWHVPPVSQAGVDGPDCPRQDPAYARIVWERDAEGQVRFYAKGLDPAALEAMLLTLAADTHEAAGGPRSEYLRIDALRLDILSFTLGATYAALSEPARWTINAMRREIHALTEGRLR